MGRDVKIPDGSGIVRSVISNLESGSATTVGDPFKMPEEIKAISCAGHSTALHMSMRRGIGVKKLFFFTELMIEARARSLHGMNTKVKSMECTGGRIKFISRKSEKVHVR